MTEKSQADVANVSHNEKDMMHEPELAHDPRRKSVALNIVENPLQVNIHRSSITIDAIANHP